jgi:carboxypeptidase C (cathepsin A)
MNLLRPALFALATMTVLAGARAAPPRELPPAPTTEQEAPKTGAAKSEVGPFRPFTPESRTSSGSVTVGGKTIAYRAVAGTLVVHPKDWDDVPRDPKSDRDATVPHGDPADAKNPTAEASMFYVAYFRNGGGDRPITFVFNGGPGSASMWLHMGAFGPKRVVTATDRHGPAAPYALVDNAHSLLDASDLVFIDAPGTGFSRVAGKDKEKAFFGVDADAYAFAEFVTQFLSKYQRWNSPRYIFGESYGTPRAAVLVNELQSERSIDVNGVILLSQILNFDLSPDRPTGNPGVDLPYQTVLPTYAATAWYHKKLPAEHPDLPAFLREVEAFAMGDYGVALAQGATLEAGRRQAIAAKLHEYTGLPVDYILKADLRIDGGEFRQTLLGDAELATGRLDTRFAAPLIDPLGQRAEYDPQSAAIRSAYVSLLNDYVRGTLGFGTEDRAYKPSIPLYMSWNWQHRQPGQPEGLRSSRQGANVMPDLAFAMKTNPSLKVQLNAGYFDLATPYFQGVYEMRHLPIPAGLQSNIEYRFYESGHMVYAKESSLTELHDNVADFIRRTTPAAAGGAARERPRR